MKILQICNKAPFPPRDGHTIAMYNLVKGLSDIGHSVKILSLNTKKHFVDFVTLTNDFLNKFNPEYIYIDTSIKLFSAFKNLFTKESYNVLRFHSLDFENVIISTLKQNKFDIVQLETLFTAPYIDVIRRYSDAKIVFRPHNVEHIIWNRRALIQRNPLLRAYIRLLSKRIRSYELDVINKFDGIAAISDIDKKMFIDFGCAKHIETFQIGFDFFEGYNPNFILPLNNLFYIGSFDWEPNINGMIWFLDRVWNKLLKLEPEIKLTIAGRGVQNHIDKLNFKNVEIAGEVESAREFIISNGIMIVPLLYGSGTRVKIIEAMTLGKVIVTTTSGAEGLPVTNWDNIIIADNEEEFVSAIKTLINNKEILKNISSNATSFAKQNFDIKRISANLIKFYEQI